MEPGRKGRGRGEIAGEQPGNGLEIDKGLNLVYKLLENREKIEMCWTKWKGIVYNRLMRYNAGSRWIYGR